MKKMLLFILLTLTTANQTLDISNLDHPLAIGLISSLVIDSTSRACLVCFAHWFLKNHEALHPSSSSEQIISYGLGALLGHSLRPELRAFWKDIKSLLSVSARINKLTGLKVEK